MRGMHLDPLGLILSKSQLRQTTRDQLIQSNDADTEPALHGGILPRKS
jgi:hypothetical protein